MCVCVCSVTQLHLTLRPYGLYVACRSTLSMGFPRQEYWSGLLFPSPGYLPNPGIEPVSSTSPALAGIFFTPDPPGKPLKQECSGGDILAGCCPAFVPVGGGLTEGTSIPSVFVLAFISTTEAFLSTCENRLLRTWSSFCLCYSVCFLWSSRFGNLSPGLCHSEQQNEKGSQIESREPCSCR